jgi:predicted CoA-binding protein
MDNLVHEFLKQKYFAVIGSFRNETKFAYKIFKFLKEEGHEVFPVNPRMDKLEGSVCYGSLSDIPHSVDVASIVTPPLVTEGILKECLKKGIKRVWIQPGAESETAIKYCRDNGIEVVYGICVMPESLKGRGSHG